MTSEQPKAFELEARHFRRLDESDDSEFYTHARFVNHIDDEAIAALTAFYRQVLPEEGALLDLMSSWVSHLPEDRAYLSVTGLGMNAEELAANPRLTAAVVHDLNRDPRLPFPDESFDAALICVSVQYLTRPIEVFADVARVLRAGSPFVLAYSNRCFPSKAIALWQVLDDRSHGELIGLYFRQSGCFDQARAYELTSKAGSDPLYAVVAHKQGGSSGPPGGT